MLNITSLTSSASAQIVLVGCHKVVAITPRSLASLATAGQGFAPLTDNDGNTINITTIVLLYRADDAQSIAKIIDVACPRSATTKAHISRPAYLQSR